MVKLQRKAWPIAAKQHDMPCFSWKSDRLPIKKRRGGVICIKTFRRHLAWRKVLTHFKVLTHLTPPRRYFVGKRYNFKEKHDRSCRSAAKGLAWFPSSVTLLVFDAWHRREMAAPCDENNMAACPLILYETGRKTKIKRHRKPTFWRHSTVMTICM